jgi:hypothetical protein
MQSLSTGKYGLAAVSCAVPQGVPGGAALGETLTRASENAYTNMNLSLQLTD